MPTGGGFYSDEQKANFRAANVLHRRGGPNEVVCGAQTRTGGQCQQKPLQGSRRCLRHAGPHAARAFRERQLQDVRRGNITPEEFAAYEARRAANRLRDNWKKNAWLAGRTIDLGEYEWTFQQESGISQRNDPLAPAVLDWLRWKYRRLQIDRKRGAEWVRVLREELPRRIEAAGTPTLEDLALIEQHAASTSTSAYWTADGKKLPFSKRQNLDQPRALSAKAVVRVPGPRKGKRRAEPSDEEILALCVKHGATLRGLFEKCRDDKERSAVVAALHDYDSKPDDTKALSRWAETVRILNTPVV